MGEPIKKQNAPIKLNLQLGSTGSLSNLSSLSEQSYQQAFDETHEPVNFAPEYFESDSQYDVGLGRETLESSHDFQKNRAEQQSTYDQIGGMLNQAIIGEVVGGTIMQAGALFSPLIGSVNKDGEEFHNFIYDIGNNISKWTQETTPIYRDPDKRFSDPAYYLQSGVSVMSFASSFIPGIGVAKGFQFLNKLMQLSKLGTAGLVAGDFIAQLGGAGAMRHAEAFRESSGTYDDNVKAGEAFIDSKTQEKLAKVQGMLQPTMDSELKNLPPITVGVESPYYKEQVINRQLSEQNIRNKYNSILETESQKIYADSAKEHENMKKAAADAAAMQYTANYANLVFDFIQLGAIMKPLRGLTRNLRITGEMAKAQELATGVIKPISKVGKTVRSIRDFEVLEKMSEGAEEVVNTTNQKEATRQFNIETGIEQEDGSSFGERVINSFADEDIQDSFIWGVIGGVVGNKLGNALNNATGGSSQMKTKLAEISKRKENLTKYIDALKTAEENGDDLTAEHIKAQMSYNISRSSVQAGNTDLLLEQIESPSFAKELKDSGLADDQVALKIKDLKETVLFVEDQYKKMYTDLRTDPRAFDYLLTQKINERHFGKLKQDATNKINEIQSKITSNNFIDGVPLDAQGLMSQYAEYQSTVSAIEESIKRLQEIDGDNRSYFDEKTGHYKSVSKNKVGKREIEYNQSTYEIDKSLPELVKKKNELTKNLEETLKLYNEQNKTNYTHDNFVEKLAEKWNVVNSLTKELIDQKSILRQSIEHEKTSADNYNKFNNDETFRNERLQEYKDEEKQQDSERLTKKEVKFQAKIDSLTDEELENYDTSKLGDKQKKIVSDLIAKRKLEKAKANVEDSKNKPKPTPQQQTNRYAYNETQRYNIIEDEEGNVRIYDGGELMPIEINSFDDAKIILDKLRLEEKQKLNEDKKTVESLGEVVIDKEPELSKDDLEEIDDDIFDANNFDSVNEERMTPSHRAGSFVTLGYLDVKYELDSDGNARDLRDEKGNIIPEQTKDRSHLIEGKFSAGNKVKLFVVDKKDKAESSVIGIQLESEFDGKNPMFFLHEKAWYYEADGKTLKEGVKQETVDEVMKIRNMMFNSSDIVLTTSILNNTPGFLNITKSTDGKKVRNSLNKTFGNSKAVIATVNADTKISFADGISRQVLNKNFGNMRIGVAFMAVPTASKRYLMTPIFTHFLNQSSQYERTLDIISKLIHTHINDKVLASKLGVDTMHGLQEEISKHVYRIKDADVQKDAHKLNPKTLFNIYEHGGHIILQLFDGDVPVNIFLNNKNNVKDVKDVKFIKEKIKNAFDKGKHPAINKLHAKDLNVPFTFVDIDKDGNLKQRSDINYLQFLDEFEYASTNIQAITDDKGNKTFVSQPVISIDTKNINNEKNIPEVKVNEPIKSDLEKETLTTQEKKADIERRRQEELNIFPESQVQETLYHNTTTDFEEFKTGKDGAIHFGDKEAARQRTKNSIANKKFTKEVRINIENLAEGVDSLDFDVPTNSTKEEKTIYFNLLKKADNETKEHVIALYKNGKITLEQANKLIDEGWSLQRIYKELFNADGYYYINQAENKGSKSYVVFNSNQIKVVNKINAKYDAELKALKQQDAEVSNQSKIEDKKADIERRRQERLKNNDIIVEDRGDNYYSLVETRGSVISFEERDSLIGKKVNFIVKNPNNNKLINNYYGTIIKHESGGITGDLRIDLELDNGQKFSIDRNGNFYTQSNVRFTEEIPDIVKEINAKYDAELAALEKGTIATQEKEVEKVTSEVKPIIPPTNGIFLSTSNDDGSWLVNNATDDYDASELSKYFIVDMNNNLFILNGGKTHQHILKNYREYLDAVADYIILNRPEFSKIHIIEAGKVVLENNKYVVIKKMKILFDDDNNTQLKKYNEKLNKKNEEDAVVTKQEDIFAETKPIQELTDGEQNRFNKRRQNGKNSNSANLLDYKYFQEGKLSDFSNSFGLKKQTEIANTLRDVVLGELEEHRKNGKVFKNSKGEYYAKGTSVPLEVVMESAKKYLNYIKESEPQFAENIDNVLNNFEKSDDFIGYRNLIEFAIEQLKYNVNINDVEVNEGDYEKTNHADNRNDTTDPENRMSGRVKRMLSQIPDIKIKEVRNEDGTITELQYPVYTMLGDVASRDGNIVFTSLVEVLADVPINRMEDTLGELKQSGGNIGMLASQVLDILNETTGKEKNEFFSVMRMTKKQYWLMKYSKTFSEELSYTNFKLMNSNQSAAVDMLVSKWKSDFVFNNNKLIKSILPSGEIVINTALAEEMRTKWNAYKDVKNRDIKGVSNLLKELGVNVSGAALVIYSKKLKKNYIANYKKKHNGKIEGIEKIENVDLLMQNLNLLFNELIKGNDIFKTEEVRLKGLAAYENIVNPMLVSNSFRNGNNDVVYGIVPSSFNSDEMHRLTSSEEYRNALLNTPFAKYCRLLKEMNSIELEKGKTLNDIFAIHFVDSLKNEKQKQSIINYEEASNFDKEVLNVNFSGANGFDYTLNLTLTPSDKTTFALVKSTRLKLDGIDFINGKIVINDNSKTLEQFMDYVLGEVERVNQTKKAFHQNKDKIDELIENYHYIKTENGIIQGAGTKLYFFPELNNIIKELGNKKTKGEYGDELDFDGNKDAIREHIKSTLIKMIEAKVSKWKEMGFVEINKSGGIQSFAIDNKYFKKDDFAKLNGIDKVNKIASDYLLNRMDYFINEYMMLTGDPAFFYAGKAKDVNSWEDILNATSDNLYKRTAKGGAPGIQGNTENKQDVRYLMIKEPISFSEISKSDLLDSDNKKAWAKKLKSADAQEWCSYEEYLEHLLSFGEIDKTQYDNLMENKNTLSNEQLKFILEKSIFGPLKPVYVNNQIDEKFNINAPYYIKTSVFPLIPQMLRGTGTELERVMDFMEKNKIDRLIPNTATKLGFRNSVKLYNDDGTFNDKLENIESNVVTLSREGLRIQQEVPYKEEKIKIQEAGQLNTLAMMDMPVNMEVKMSNGKSIKANELRKAKDRITNEIYRRHWEELVDKLGFVKTPTGYVLKDMGKLQKMLIEEAINKKMPYNDILGLKSDENGFIIPLMFSGVHTKIEQLMQSLVSNRVLKIKLPGKSLVQASPVGFSFNKNNVKTQSQIDSTNIVWINGHEGKELDYKIDENGGVYAEVLLPSYFIKDGKQIQVTKEMLKNIDKELLELVGYRIPNQGRSSTIKLKVVGFLPNVMGDLVVVPGGVTLQMGSDFDVDKLYIHRYNYKFSKDGGINKLRHYTSSVEEYMQEKYSKELNQIYKNYEDAISEAKLKIKRSEDKQESILNKLKEKKTLEEEELNNLFHSKREIDLEKTFILNDIKINKSKTKEIEDIYEENQEDIISNIEEIYGKDIQSILYELDEEADKLEQELLLVDEKKDNIDSFIKSLSLTKTRKDAILDRISKKKTRKEELYEDLNKIYSSRNEELITLKENITKEFNSLPLIERWTQKQLENKVIDMYLSVLSSPELVNQILSPLDTKRIDDVIEYLNSITPDEEKGNFVQNAVKEMGFINPDYQQTVVQNNAAGKTGVSAWSSIMTGHITFQQSGIYLKNVLQRVGDNYIIDVNKTVSVKFLKENGELYTDVIGDEDNSVDKFEYKGHVKEGAFRLDKIRTFNGELISDTNKLIQSASVDNAKDLQLIKLNLNNETFNVAALISETGFGLDFIGAFLRQPIIVEYIKQLRNLDKITDSEFSKSKVKEFTENFFKEYIKDEKFQETHNVTAFSLKDMHDMISTELDKRDDEYKKKQALILNNFLKYDNVAKEILGLRTSLNTDTQFLDKSIAASIEKKSKLEKNIYRPTYLGNTENLIKETKKGGASEILSDSIDLFTHNSLFPTNNLLLTRAMERIEVILDKDNLSEKDVLQTTYAFKSAIVGVIAKNTFNTDNIENERRRLLYGDNSLAYRIAAHINSSPNNLFLNSLILNLNGELYPSFIEFQSSKDSKEIFDYSNPIAWLELINSNNPIEKEIGLDLIKYDLLFGDDRNAKDFNRFMPSDWKIENKFGPNIKTLLSDINNKEDYTKDFADRFVTQFMQHNPTRAKRIDNLDFAFDLKTIGGEKTTLSKEIPNSFRVETKGDADKMKSIWLENAGATSSFLYYFDKKTQQNVLYKLDSTDDNYVITYKRVGLLGGNLLTEYDLTRDNISTVIEPKNIIDTRLSKPTQQNPNKVEVTKVETSLTENKPLSVSEKYKFSEGPEAVLNTLIDNGSTQEVKLLAKFLLDNLIHLNTINKITESKVIEDMYDNKEGEIIIHTSTNSDHNAHRLMYGIDIRTAEGLERVILHELTHGLLFDKIKNKDSLSPKQKEAVNGLISLFNNLKNNKELQSKIKDNSMSSRAFDNIQEFVSVLFSNREFQELLNDTKTKGNKSILDKILQLFKNILGIDVKTDHALAAVLDEIIKLSNNEADTNKNKTDIEGMNVDDDAFNSIYNKKEIDKKYNEELLKDDLSDYPEGDFEEFEEKQIINNEFTFPDGVKVKTKFKLNSQQSLALNEIGNFLNKLIESNDTFDITYTLQGYAGTGKTTLTKIILDYLDKKYKKYSIASPTHRAKEILIDKSGRNALTLAKLLGMAPGIELDNFNLHDKIFTQQKDDFIPINGILIIDEASMINDDLYDMIIDIASNKGTKVLFIGDDAQLKPVKQKKKSKAFRRNTNISTLTKVERTSDGNPMPSEVLQLIRDNIHSENDSFEHITKVSNKEEGIIFTNKVNEWTDDMLSKFSLENLNKNPNHVRALAYTNKRVEELNSLIRNKMFGIGSEVFYKGEFMMMYENLFYLPSGDYVFPNGSDVIIDNVEFVENQIISSPSGTSFNVPGYLINFLDTKSRSKKRYPLFIADMNMVSKDYLLELKKLHKIALSSSGKQRAIAWTNYYSFSNKYNLTKDIYIVNDKIFSDESNAYKELLSLNEYAKKSDLGKYKIKDKSIDYSYAHTIHKSQGGEYENAFVDENNIDIARKFNDVDYEGINQMKYVAFSRGSKITYSLSAKTNNKITSDKKNIQDNVVNPSKPSVQDLSFMPKYKVDENLKNADGSKRLAQTKGGEISLNPVKSLDEFFNYFEGKEKGITSEQKGLVLLELGLKGYSLSLLKEKINTNKLANTFLIWHEQSHIDNKDVDKYPRTKDGKLDLLNQKAIDIETRATIDALKRMDIKPNNNDENNWIVTNEQALLLSKDNKNISVQQFMKELNSIERVKFRELIKNKDVIFSCK